MSDFFQLVNQRESCRNYDPDKRPTKEQLINCIKAAQLALLPATRSHGALLLSTILS